MNIVENVEVASKDCMDDQANQVRENTEVKMENVDIPEHSIDGNCDNKHNVCPFDENNIEYINIDCKKESVDPLKPDFDISHNTEESEVRLHDCDSEENKRIKRKLEEDKVEHFNYEINIDMENMESPEDVLLNESMNQDVYYGENYNISGQDSSNELSCPICGYVATRKAHLTKHIDSVHVNVKQHRCHICGHTSNRKDHLKRHIDSVHKKNSKHSCDLCDFTSTRKDHLKRHIDSIHLKLKRS